MDELISMIAAFDNRQKQDFLAWLVERQRELMISTLGKDNPVLATLLRHHGPIEYRWDRGVGPIYSGTGERVDAGMEQVAQLSAVCR